MFKKLLVVFCIILCCSKFALADPVSLIWSANTDLPIGGYKVHIGTASGQYDNIVDVGDVTQYTTEDLPQGETYYFAVSAYRPAPDTDIESGYSLEVFKRIPYGTPNNPTGLELVLDETSADIGVFLNKEKVGYISQESVNLFPIGFKEYRFLGRYKIL